MARTVLFCCLFAAVAAASDLDELRQDIASLRFLNALDLSRDQVRGLLPIAEGGAVLRRDFDRDRDRLMVRFHSALVRFKEEDLRNQGLSPAVTAAAGGIKHQLNELGNRVAAAMDPLERLAAVMLTPAQRKLAMQSDERGHPLDLLRHLKFSDFDELRDNLARRLARTRVKAGLVTRHDNRKERLRIRRLLGDVKHLQEGEYLAQREEMLRALVPGRERDTIARQVHAIYRARYGRAGPLAEHLFRERMLGILAERAGVPTPKLPPMKVGSSLPGNLERVRAEVAEMKADINLLNLMNGLHLTPEQLAVIVRGAKACATARVEQEDVSERVALSAMRDVYSALRRAEPAPQGALSRLQSPTAKRGHGYARARRKEYVEARDESLDRLLTALGPEQRDVLRTYKSCLVPPKNLRDPVRVGQARDASRLENLVDRLRRLPLNDSAEAVAGGLLASIEAHDGRFPADVRRCRVMLMLGVAFEAQGLGEATYVARRAALATRLEPLYRLDALKDRAAALDGADRVIRRKAGAFLLAPRIVPLAQDRIQRLANQAPMVRPDIPKAEICEEGECGKP